MKLDSHGFCEVYGITERNRSLEIERFLNNEFKLLSDGLGKKELGALSVVKKVELGFPLGKQKVQRVTAWMFKLQGRNNPLPSPKVFHLVVHIWFGEVGC